MAEPYTDPSGREFRSQADADLFARRIRLRDSGLFGRIGYWVSGVFRRVFGLGPKGSVGHWNW